MPPEMKCEQVHKGTSKSLWKGQAFGAVVKRSFAQFYLHVHWVAASGGGSGLWVPATHVGGTD